MDHAALLRATIEQENTPHMPDPAVQQEYAKRHGGREHQGFKELSDIQVASRARMLMRDDWTHEAVCTAVRDRICALVLEKQELLEALERLCREADPLDRAGLHEAFEQADAAIAKAKGEA